MPASAADVAAPIRKLCPAYCGAGRPRDRNTVLIWSTKAESFLHYQQKKWPWLSTPGTKILTHGQYRVVRAPVTLTTTSAPWLSWSLLVYFKCSCTIWCAMRSSTATSLHAKSVAAFHDVAASSKSSPNRNKAKKNNKAKERYCGDSPQDSSIRICRFLPGLMHSGQDVRRDRESDVGRFFAWLESYPADARLYPLHEWKWGLLSRVRKAHGDLGIPVGLPGMPSLFVGPSPSHLSVSHNNIMWVQSV